MFRPGFESGALELGGSTNLHWRLGDLGGGRYRIVNRTNGMAADNGGDAMNGATCRPNAHRAINAA